MALPALMFVLPVLNTATSANEVTVVRTWALVSVPLLLVGFGSSVPEVAKAMFVKLPPAAETAVTVKLLTAFLARLIAGQLTRLFKTDDDGDALTNVNPAGNRSDTTTLVAVEGPLLVTVTV